MLIYTVQYIHEVGTNVTLTNEKIHKGIKKNEIASSVGDP